MNGVQKILDQLKAEPVGAEDLEAAKKQVRVSYLRSFGSNSSLASTLAHAELLWGSWKAMLDQFELLQQITAGDLQQTARKYFHLQNRTVVVLQRDRKSENKKGEQR